MATPEQVAARHQADRERLLTATSAVAADSWSRVEPDQVLRSWLGQVPRLTAAVSGAQLAAARGADDYLDDVLDAQDLNPASAGLIEPRAFAGVASDGRPLESLLVQPALSTLAALASGVDRRRALAGGAATLDMMVRTQVADAGRGADQVALTSRRTATGYTRVLTPPSCSRCAVLAGRFYRWNAGFQRHPRCDCVHLPGRLDTVGKQRLDVDAYFGSLSRAEQDRIFTKAGAEAIRDGADIGQVVNARRGMSTATVGGRQVLVTTEGTTVRGLFGGYEIDPVTGRLRRRPEADLLRRQSGTRFIRAAQRPRLMPEEIYRIAGGNRDEAIRLLRSNGYLRDAPVRVPVRRGDLVAAANRPAATAAGATKTAAAKATATTVRPALEQARTVGAVNRAFEVEAKRITGRDIRGYLDGSAATAREHAEGVLRGLERFPNATLRRIGAFGSGQQDGAYAVAWHDGRIQFGVDWTSPAARRKYLSSLKNDGAGWDTLVREFGEMIPGHGFHPRNTGTPMGVAIHEFGHIIDIATLAKRIRPKLNEVLDRRVAIVQKEMNARRKAAGLPTFKINREYVARREIGDYAGKTSEELVAEAFADVMVNGDAASGLSREIFDILESAYRASHG